jgi:cysteine desulfurase
VNGDDKNRLPNTCNIAFEYIEGEAILHHMDRAGIAASTGSACTAGSSEPSHVLKAMNLPATALNGAIRLSFSRENTGEDVDRVLEVLPEIIVKLRELSPTWQTRQANGSSA